MRTSCALASSIVVALLSTIIAQPTTAALRGSWAATSSSKQVFRGTWSAQTIPGTPNKARGTWTVLNNANQVVLEGVWEAEKSPQRWQGTWSAQIKTGQAYGPTFTGTWQTAFAAPADTTFVELLQRTLETEITGSWRSRGQSGSWALRGLAR